MFHGLDHVAILVPDTEAALLIWRDRFGLPVVHQEVVSNGTFLLTHLDVGNTQLQLVEVLQPEHPLAAQARLRGPHLHHLCFRVADVGEAFARGPERGLPPGEPAPHQGTRGQRALFLDPAAADGVRVELTGP